VERSGWSSSRTRIWSQCSAMARSTNARLWWGGAAVGSDGAGFGAARQRALCPMVAM
jgi:hypothetical protein